jgi:acyl-coenzyme A synthetase/AMP-(fatty) acid ligase
VDPKHQQRFEQRFGFPLIEGWAMTETGAGAMIVARGAAPRRQPLLRQTGAGLPAEASWMTTAPMSPGEPASCSCAAPARIREQGFFSGYYKDEAATSEAWRGGWFHTGDVVGPAPMVRGHFVDRKKNVIRRSGENIAAVEVEGALFQHPAVLNCAVAPVADDIRGEEVIACILLHEGIPADRAMAETLFAHCSERLAYFKAPGWLAFVDSLPTTATQKVQRGEMKKLVAELVDSGRALDLRELKRQRRG